MRELDVLLTRYLEQAYPAADGAEQAAFRRLLEATDPDLIGWLLGRAEPPDEPLRALVGRIRRSN